MTDAPKDPKKRQSVRLTSHPDADSIHFKIQWGAKDPAQRGPVVATLTDASHRNAIGTHSGSYAVYRALAVAAGALADDHRADLTNTAPPVDIGPFPSWGDPKRIVSIDPWGAKAQQVFADALAAGIDIRPSIAVTKAHINMPELRDAIRAGRLVPDGELLTAGGDVVVTKAAVEPVWWLPGIAERFGLTEAALRRGLFEHTGGMFPELITRPDLEVFLPPIGGLTIYFFGPVHTIPDPSVPLAMRVHDECNGSDVFGSDICTCRPYLAHGIEVCVETAQKGGAGVIVYSRKEGRALGEVTKFLVYNARKRQEGGDSAATYFHRTECVAGVQDMRFQELMPDALHWLGVTKIDRFVSMSDMKYNAITKSGIEIVERVPIPEELIPEDAKVEMEAKKAAGYFTDQKVRTGDELTAVKGRDFESVSEAAAYLLSARAVRERCHQVYELGLAGKLPSFTVHPERLPEVADLVARVTRAAYPNLAIPIHGRFRHFDAAGLERLHAGLEALSPKERARAQVDLVVTSVLLDAGAGAGWRYVDETGKTWSRSEGLAVASLRMFLAGAFSSDPAHPLRADATGLLALNVDGLGRGFQVTTDNPLAGLEGRLALLHGLGRALPRPGALVNRIDGRELPGARLLEHVLEALGGIWPGRLTLDGRPLGDVWRCETIQGLVPFHKLSQWLTYSLVEPLAAAGIQVVRLDELTGLPEYRNGGLFLDLGVIVPVDPELTSRRLTPASEEIVVWRALTVALLDELAPLVRAELGKPDLPLANILEGGTWAAGRQIAAQRRPGGPPPLDIESDGTVF